MCFNSMNNNNAAYTSQYTKYSTLTLYTTSLRTLAVYFKESQNLNSMFLKSFLIFSKFKVVSLLFCFVILGIVSFLYSGVSFLHFALVFFIFAVSFLYFVVSFPCFPVSFLYFAVVSFILL